MRTPLGKIGSNFVLNITFRTRWLLKTEGCCDPWVQQRRAQHNTQLETQKKNQETNLFERLLSVRICVLHFVVLLLLLWYSIMMLDYGIFVKSGSWLEASCIYHVLISIESKKKYSEKPFFLSSRFSSSIGLTSFIILWRKC